MSLLFMAVGMIFAVASLGHPLGEAARMGRGFFPFWVAIILILLGAWMLFQTRANPSQEEPFSVDVKPFVTITASVVVFALLLPFAGLYVATVATVLLAAKADATFGWREATVLGLCLAVVGHLAFVVGIGLQLPLWPSFLDL